MSFRQLLQAIFHDRRELLPPSELTKAEVLTCIYTPTVMMRLGRRYRDAKPGTQIPDVTEIVAQMVRAHLAIDHQGLHSDTGLGVEAARCALDRACPIQAVAVAA